MTSMLGYLLPSSSRIIAIGAIAIGFMSIGAIAVGLFARGAVAAGYFIGYGEYAYSAKIAVGAQWASGGIYQSCSGIQQVYDYNKQEVIELIDENIKAFSWFKSIFKAML